MLGKVFATIVLIVLSTAVMAQELPRTVLVFDGSGSMWGQIEGTAKVTIAQDVVADLMQSLPEQQTIGLVAYGHNRKGDCNDIETLIQPSVGNRGAIVEAVRGISPKGKTPLSAAVMQAAEGLKYAEDEATVILLSDGIETCGLDPCEVGRALEASGINFTAHVIGFDVKEAEGQAQLQCLAAETGGLYRDASNAAELASALTEVVATPEIVLPVPAQVRFMATNGEGGAVIDDPLLWEINSLDVSNNPDIEEASEITRMLTPGNYQIRVARLASEDAPVIVGVRVLEQAQQRVVIALPRALPEATIMGPPSAEIGSRKTISWTGPGVVTDRIEIRPAGTAEVVAQSAVGQTGNVSLIMPATPGLYDVVYVMDDGDVVLASQPLEVVDAVVSLDFAPAIEAGYPLEIEWVGPGNTLDYIRIVASGTTDRFSEASTRRSSDRGGTVTLTAPAEPGSYDVIYYFDQDREVLVRRPVTVTETRATLTAPVNAAAGSEIAVSWTGPGSTLDQILLRKPFETRVIASQYVSNSNGTVTLQLPTTPGAYELIYLLEGTRQALVTANISVTEN